MRRPDEIDSEVLGILRQHAHYFPVDDVPEALTENLADYGLDSLSQVDLLLDLEETMGFVFPDESIDEHLFESAGTVLAAVHAAIGAPLAENADKVH